jgi:hypothetical protein
MFSLPSTRLEQRVEAGDGELLRHDRNAPRRLVVCRGNQAATDAVRRAFRSKNGIARTLATLSRSRPIQSSEGMIGRRLV